VVVCGIWSAVRIPRAVIIPDICAAWMGLKKAIRVPTGITGVGPGTRGLALRWIIRALHWSLISGMGVACREMLPAEEPAIVVSRGPTIVSSDMLSRVIAETIKDATKC